MAARDWASLLGGLALAAAGLGAVAAAGHGDPSAPAAPPVTAVTAPPVTAPAPSPDAGLPAAVEAVLAGNGPLEVIDPAVHGIPAEVARVLAERGVVLTVTAEPPATPLEGRGR